MLCNNYTYGMTKQPGDQPIRVFYEKIEQDFCNIRGGMNILIPNRGIDKVELVFVTSKDPIRGPYTNGSKIFLQDTFLSYLWAHSYSTLTTMPIPKIKGEDIDLARKLRAYAIKLLHEYEPWDKEFLPNPELHNKYILDWMGIANFIFTAAVRFIIHHEFAHIFYRHPWLENHQLTSENRKKMEFEADSAALLWSLGNPQGKLMSEQCGIVVALFSICFLSKNFEETKFHPSPEDRIVACLEKMKLDDKSLVWSIGFFSMLEWQFSYDLFYMPGDDEPRKPFSQKLIFYDLIKELKEFKSTGKRKFHATPTDLVKLEEFRKALRKSE